jgi:hypothetical protein
MPETAPDRRTAAGAIAPALIIRVPFEGAPVVYVDAVDEGEERRLVDWLAVARPDYGEFAARAMELAEKARAA